MIWNTNELVLFLGAVAAFLVVQAAGFRLGLRDWGKADGDAKPHVHSLQNAALGLLALLLGFTFAMAVQRFDARKALVLEEANAIGTAYLRSKMLPAPQAAESAKLYRELAGARLDFFEAGIDAAKLDAASASTDRIGARLWSLALEVSAADPKSVPMGLYVDALNAVIDALEKRRVALENHVPEAVIALLFAVAAVALGITAYGCGLSRQRRFRSNAVFAVTIALVLTVILDIDRPRRGVVQVSQASLERLKAQLDAEVR